MTRHPWVLRLTQRFVLRTARSPLRLLWLLGYALIGVADVLYLTRGRRNVTVYLSRSAASGEFLPGLSDLDLVLIAATRHGAQPLRQRRDHVEGSLPSLRAVLDRPMIHSESELADLSRANAFTFGIGSSVERDRGAYFGAAASTDAIRTLVLPGLDPPARNWRRVAGRERRPAASVEPGRDAHAQRLACWLELSNWWRIVFPMCLAPSAANAAAKCVKLLADTAATWLRLAWGERTAGREDSLRRALVRAPQEEDALRRALELHRALPRSPRAPLEEVLPAVGRFSAKIVDLITAGAANAEVTPVRLAGADRRSDFGELPLCDWVGLAWPAHAQEWMSPADGDIGDPALLAALSREYRPGAYRAVTAGQLIVLPAPTNPATRLRAIKCPPADPVVFALASARDVAVFPELAGWSALDTARRATAEHRSWLRTGVGPVARVERRGIERRELALLLTAARAALFLESVMEGEPVLTVSAEATAARLGERVGGTRPLAFEAVQASLTGHSGAAADPARDLVAPLRRAVCELPAYSMGVSR